MNEEQLMKLDLQYFSEPDKSPEGSTPEGGANNPDDQNGDEPEKTVNVEEMKRRISKEQEKYEQQINELKENQEKQIQEAVEKAQKEAQLSGKELEEYRQKEAERKHQEELKKRDEQIQEYQQKEKQREIRDESINKLDELGLTVNEDSLELVNADSLDDMASKADKLANLLKAQRNKNAQTDPPIGSGGNNKTNDTKSGLSALDDAKITGF